MSEFYKKPAPAGDLGPLFEPPPPSTLHPRTFTPLPICPIPETEALVYGAIRACEGRKAALSMTAVAEHAGCATRQVQVIIKHLVEEHGCKIGSSTGKPHGYFWIVDPEDLARFEGQLKGRIIETARHLRAINKNALADVMGQLKLEVGA